MNVVPCDHDQKIIKKWMTAVTNLDMARYEGVIKIIFCSFQTENACKKYKQLNEFDITRAIIEGFNNYIVP